MPVPEGLDGSIRVLQQPLDRIYLQATSGMALIDRLDALDSIRLVAPARTAGMWTMQYRPWRTAKSSSPAAILNRIMS